MAHPKSVADLAGGTPYSRFLSRKEKAGDVLSAAHEAYEVELSRIYRLYREEEKQEYEGDEK